MMNVPAHNAFIIRLFKCGKIYDAMYSSTGKRLKEARHELSLPRTARIDSDGNLIITSDQASDLPFNFIEWISNKNSAETPDRSDIVIQKKKL